MPKEKIIPIQKEFEKNAFITADQYRELYQRSIDDPENFWAEQAEKFITWFSPWKSVQTGDFKNLNVRWFEGATLNASTNCLDRHLETRPNAIALIWEGDNP